MTKKKGKSGGKPKGAKRDAKPSNDVEVSWDRSPFLGAIILGIFKYCVLYFNVILSGSGRSFGK